MIFNVKLSRLLRKRALDSNVSASNRPTYSVQTRSTWRILFNAIIQTASPSLVVGYLVGFSYSASLSPTTLLAAVFVAFVASLLSEICRYEYFTCRRNTSASCSYICTYQIMGEISAHVYGWLQLLSRAAVVALIGRLVGSTLVLIIGKRLVHILPDEWVNEEVIGVLAQVIVSLFVFLGLKMTIFFTVAIKLSLLLAIIVFLSQIGSLTSTPANPELEQQSLADNEEISTYKEQLLVSAALLSVLFKPENKEPQIYSKSSLMSTFLGIQSCSTLFIFVIISIIYCLLPARFLVAIQSGSPMFEVLTNVTEGRHWSAAIFACSCILIGCLSLVEAIQDSKRLVTKMSSDGLIVKQLAVKNQWAALLFNGLMSVAVQLTVSTLHLILFVNGVHLLFDSMLGLIVTYRRYCGSPFLRRTKNRSDQNVYRVLPAPEARGHRDGEPAASDSDDTDIDAAVDDFKNQMYVSTVMQWNGSEELNNGQTNDGKWPPSTKVAYYLSAVCLLISILSLSVRWINYASFGVAVFSFVAYNAILFAIWNHPQRPTATNPVFRVPCVPFIPLGSTLLNCIMLFQLPAVPWMTILLWLAIGVAVYFGYGYKKSRLNFKVETTKTAAKQKQPKRQQRMHILHDSMLDVTSSSIAVYPQPYYKI